MRTPTKTFGLSDPMDVFIKLEFDLNRLKAATSSKDLQYAALDCAIWAFHMVDWVLAAVSDDDHWRLSGRPRDHGKAVQGFVDNHREELGALPICQQIATTGKHRVLTRTPDDPSFVTGHNILFDPPFVLGDSPYKGKIRAVVYLRDIKGNEIEAAQLFQAMWAQWRNFLQREKLFHWGYDQEPVESEFEGGESDEEFASGEPDDS